MLGITMRNRCLSSWRRVKTRVKDIVQVVENINGDGQNTLLERITIDGSKELQTGVHITIKEAKRDPTLDGETK